MSTFTTGDHDSTPASPDGSSDPRDWRGHVIVCGTSSIGLRAMEQLDAIGVPVAVAREHGPVALAQAGLPGAQAVICTERSDLDTLETALLVRDLRPDVRVVVHLDNPSVGRAVAELTGDGSVLDVAGLFAPAVVDGCLGRTSHDLALGVEDFVAVEVLAPRLGSLRELYGDLAPIGIVSRRDERVEVCPGRDEVVSEGDRVTLLGTREQVREAGLVQQEDVGDAAARFGQRLGSRGAQAWQGIAGATDRAVRATLLIGLFVLVLSALVLHAFYNADGEHMNLLQALYFTFETAATVGFGDYSFAHQTAAMQVFGIFLIVAGTTLVSLLFALVTNALVSRRIEQSLGRGQLRGIAGHVVVIGLGSVGMRAVEGIVADDREVVVIERDEDNRYIAQARALGVPVVIGDATLGQTLRSVNLTTAAAVAIMTSDDLTNLESGLAVRDRLGERWHTVPVILRVFDRALGRRLEDSFEFRHVWSTSALAAPWFVGAAIGFGVIHTFYVGNTPFLVARLPVSADGGLAGLPMRDLSARVRVIAIGRGGDGGVLEHPPRRDTRFVAGDEAYMVGPYEELLHVVRRDRDVAGGAATPG
jgi:Trk K+ transport system NAD-binding subunit